MLDKAGQNYLQTVEKVIDKVADQEVMIALVRALQVYFRKTWPIDYSVEYRRLPEEIDNAVAAMMQTSETEQHSLAMIAQVLQHTLHLNQKVEALLKLSLVGESLLNPIFSQTDAVGSVMRKRLQPVTDWLLDNIAVLKS